MLRPIVVVMTLMCGAPAASAQGRFPPASFVNLKVLPKDSPPANVIALMKNMTLGLGVRCQHCHVGEEGQPLDRFDFASDSKPAKAAARVMLKLVLDINATLDRELPASGKTGRVSCMTCHNGKPVPRRIHLMRIVSPQARR